MRKEAEKPQDNRRGPGVGAVAVWEAGGGKGPPGDRRQVPCQWRR